jgi:hypothetical protein
MYIKLLYLIIEETEAFCNQHILLRFTIEIIFQNILLAFEEFKKNKFIQQSYFSGQKKCQSSSQKNMHDEAGITNTNQYKGLHFTMLCVFFLFFLGTQS